MFWVLKVAKCIFLRSFSKMLYNEHKDWTHTTRVSAQSTASTTNAFDSVLPCVWASPSPSSALPSRETWTAPPLPWKTVYNERYDCQMYGFLRHASSRLLSSPRLSFAFPVVQYILVSHSLSVKVCSFLHLQWLKNYEPTPNTDTIADTRGMVDTRSAHVWSSSRRLEWSGHPL